MTSPSKKPTRAVWTLNVRKRSAEEDGTMKLLADLMDKGTTVGQLEVSITADRQLMLVYTNEPGADPMTNFQAWMKENG